jgi:hypothetical protein
VVVNENDNVDDDHDDNVAVVSPEGREYVEYQCSGVPRGNTRL